MSGSARPKRRRAAAPALRYEHSRARPPSSWQQAKKRMSKRETLFAWLFFLALAAAIVGFALTTALWGPDLWGRVAPAWPGGGYGFAVAVGAAVPFGLAAMIAPLTRMNWKKSRARSLAWAAAALPGLTACLLFLLVVTATGRPKHRRDGDSECYSTGNACWIHEQYPYVWAVGLATTLLSATALILVLVKLANARQDARAVAPEPSAT